MQVQYDLFSDNDELSLIHQEIEQIDERTRKVQRGLFSRHNNLSIELYKLMEHQDAKILKLERQLEDLRKMLLKEAK